MCVITIIYHSILQVQWCRTKPVLQNFSLWIEIRERRSLLYVRHHGRIAYPETTVNPAATTTIFQHVQEFVLLTRFNKIATQGAPQMAVDKEANSLSRVYSYYSKFNLCLFYV